MNKLWITLTICIVTFLAGIALGYQLFSGKVKIVERDKPAIVLHDTSIVIERKTDTVPTIKLVKVPYTEVIHDVEIRIVPDTTVKLDTLIKGDTIYITKTIGHDTITVTMAILKEKDGSIRVQAKATNGKIVGAIDIPKESLFTNKPLKNFVGVEGSFAPKDGVTNVGLMYNRSIGAFVIGGVVGSQVNRWDNVSIGVQTGVRF